jgi:Holliday junction resolvase-like predicted endonuclease
MSEKKNTAAEHFEDWIRERLRDKGYDVPEEHVRLEKYEYDVIAVHEKSNRIVLVEAKYKDFSPSSISGKTLLQSELYDEKEGLLTEAIRQFQRHQFFVSQFDKFRKLLPINRELCDYAVDSFIVTKYRPLISKYRKIGICSANSFLERQV